MMLFCASNLIGEKKNERRRVKKGNNIQREVGNEERRKIIGGRGRKRLCVEIYRLTNAKRILIDLHV